MDFSDLGTIVNHLEPLINYAIPVVGASLILTRFYKIIKK